MVGIQFKVKNEFGSPLKKIFNNIAIEKYNWKVAFSEAYEHNNVHMTLGNNVFDKDILSGKQFYKESQVEKYYIIFLTVLAFRNKADIVEINNYNDFINSKSEIAFICSDTEYVVLYCKNKEMLEQIITNCRNNNFEDIEIITEENNTIFSFM